MKKTIGILAHVDAGKTTLTESMLYHMGAIRKKGRVDHKTAIMDYNAIEKARGITVYTEQISFNYQGDAYTIIDTPGHVDFSQEMERALSVLDYAVLVVSAVEGVQAHTQTVWNLLNKKLVPTFLFINKIDRNGADIERVHTELQLNLSSNIFLQEKQDAIKEALATEDEAALEAFIDGNDDEVFWGKKLREGIKQRNIFLCFAGAALLDEGIEHFVKQFHQLTETQYSENQLLIARPYRIRCDSVGNAELYIKIMQGKLTVRDYVEVKGQEITRGQAQNEGHKITQIKTICANKATAVLEAWAGEVVAVSGIPPHTIQEQLSCVPALMVKVNFDMAQKQFIITAFETLEAEDATLNGRWDEELNELHLSIMGIVQLEILQTVLEERFNLQVEFSKPSIRYKETIKETVYGYGHFEPLKHYAEVHLKLESLPRNSGIQFESVCHTDHLQTGQQNTIKAHVYERIHRGILTGSELTDVKITLLTGRDHNKHTHGGDFREATYRAIRQALEQAENVLLEPVYKFTIQVGTEHLGRVMTDLQKYMAQSELPLSKGNSVIIKGTGPVATLMNYSLEVATFTHGKGMVTFQFGGYLPCHNQQDVIVQKAYDKNEDPLYTSTSIFCSKGKGYPVPWQEAKEAMHCPFVE